MMCKTGCGVEANYGRGLCESCRSTWLRSHEFARAAHFEGLGAAHKGNAAMMDFCTRLRAERLNGGK